ncbi:aromatic ring-hydroxylating dioxygenase subunit alpha [Paenalcaligenes niemegkensis]|uniref:aromatic ring-hydroxylating dioxygenase subunit alpha n=1 Tax=Paenalcaligenes niemegkensis TaxID=2895469 RepID=UPI001EE8A044|nr:aromatic ring-hydroxylating dioxygenase subunit alpha [Paenalcaligenes niemegkensis]MCQ9616114.1 aromatic ring-hydroxylating dioxygenase subunit alpha [Paenalcaligenes niemegkensis]
MQNYVTNTWYPLTWSRDIGRELSAHRIIEKDVVLFRSTEGTVIAMEDACPHRLLPLSMGKLKGDHVECGYHGVTFDCAGSCVRVPGQDMVPANARVQTYPTHENMGLVWIWMGDPELADPATVFDLEQYHDPSWTSVEGDALHIRANYLSLADNLCDPAHVSFVHQTTLGNAAGEDVPVQYAQEEGKMLTWRWVNDAPPIPLFAKFGNFKGNVDRWHYYHYYAPSIAIIDFGSADTGTGAPEGNRDDCIQIFACHFMTPVDQENSIDHWLHVKNFKADEETNLALSASFREAFAEDKAILEAIEINENKYRGRKKIKIAIDAAPRRMRKMVEQMSAEESLVEA